jgi:ABC-type multidrug transport system fused ATPase/permease subunit
MLEQSPWSVVMIFYYTNMIMWPLERITQQFQDLQRAGASLVRVMGIQRTQGKISGEDNFRLPEEGLLRPGPLQAFEGVSTAAATAFRPSQRMNPLKNLRRNLTQKLRRWCCVASPSAWNPAG